MIITRFVLRIFFFLAVFSTPLLVSGQEVFVRIFEDKPLTTCIIEPSQGQYLLLSPEGQEIYKLKAHRALILSASLKGIKVQTASETLGEFKWLSLVKHTPIFSRSETHQFRILPVAPQYPDAFFDGTLNIGAQNGELLLDNRLHIDDFIAGILAENKEVENPSTNYYATRALMIRTHILFLLANSKKRRIALTKEDYGNLTYIGSIAQQLYVRERDTVMAGLRLTRNMVITNSKKQLIDPIYHLNSGGMTANPLHVLQADIEYLRPIRDEHSLSGRHAIGMRKAIPIDKWTAWLDSMVYELNIEDLPPSSFAYEQPIRQRYYALNNDTVPLVTTLEIQNRWNLPSAFFDVDVDVSRQRIIFNCRGDGHGLGLSLEGAANMAIDKQTPEQIIYYYFFKVQLSLLSDVPEIENLIRKQTTYPK